jgi:hypothetical protein
MATVWQIYSDEFIRAVNQRHKIAKTYFARLSQYDTSLEAAGNA